MKLVLSTNRLGVYEDFVVYEKISSIKVELKGYYYRMCCFLPNGTVSFYPEIFETMQNIFEEEYGLLYTLLALITKIINSNSMYLKYTCVTSPRNSYEDLSYNEAVSQYSKAEEKCNIEKSH